MRRPVKKLAAILSVIFVEYLDWSSYFFTSLFCFESHITFPEWAELIFYVQSYSRFWICTSFFFDIFLVHLSQYLLYLSMMNTVFENSLKYASLYLKQWLPFVESWQQYRPKKSHKHWIFCMAGHLWNLDRIIMSLCWASFQNTIRFGLVLALWRKRHKFTKLLIILIN